MDSGRTVLSWALEAVDRGAGELMVTAADRDGIEGLDLALTQTLSRHCKFL